jgi:hypothetical protein
MIWYICGVAHSNSFVRLLVSYSFSSRNKVQKPTPIRAWERLSWTSRSHNRCIIVDRHVMPLNNRINSEKYKHTCYVDDLNLSGQVPLQGT